MYKLTYNDIFEHYEIARAIINRVMALHCNLVARILRDDRDMAHVSNIDAAAQLLSMSLRGIAFNSTEKKDDRLQRDLAYVCRIFYHGLRGAHGHKVKSVL
jgi:hypothetical protein